MKKILIGCATLLLVCSIFCDRLIADIFKPNPVDFIVELRGEFHLYLPFKLYKIQNILEVPDVEIQSLDNGKQILCYRSECHNGTDNSCLKIFCELEGYKVTPFFVLEELVYLSNDEYWLRVPIKVSFDTIAFDLFRIKQTKRKKMLSVELKKKGNQDFEISSLNVFDKEFSQAYSKFLPAVAVHFDDSYDYIKEKILTNTY